MSGVPYFDSDELQVLFGYKTKASMYVSISRGHFPVQTYRLRRQIVADREVVRRYFELKREEGLADLEKRRKPKS